jgi:hypothetical protein
VKSKIRIAVLVIVGIGALFYSYKKFYTFAVPAQFQTLASRFEHASSVQIDLLWPQPGATRQNPASVRWDRTGKMAADVLEGPQGRLTLINGMVKLTTADIQLPIPALNEPAQQLYEELLTGFANSHWRPMAPPSRGILPPRQDRVWAGITLPFDWAQGHTLQLGLSKETGKLEAIVVQALSKPTVSVTFNQFRGGARTFEVSDSPQLWLVIEDVRWNQTIPPDDLDPSQHP